MKTLKTLFKNKTRIKYLITLVVLSLTLSITLPFSKGSTAQGGNISENNTRISELQKKASQISEENKEREKKISEMKNDVEQSESFIKEVDKQIEQIESQIDTYRQLINIKQDMVDKSRTEIEKKETEILNTSNRISQRQAEIERLDNENKLNAEKFGKIIAQLYMNSNGDTFELLTGATSFYDVLVKTEMIKNIGEKNAEFLEGLLESIENQESEIKALEVDISTLESEKSIFEEEKLSFEIELEQLSKERESFANEVDAQYIKLNALVSERDEVKEKVNSLSGQVESAVNEIHDIEKKIAELEAENIRIENFLNRDQSSAERPVYSSSGFIYPVEARFSKITNPYGPSSFYQSGIHTGVDFGTGGINGTNVYAVQSGTVVRATDGGGWNGGYGNHVIIDHGGGVATLYAHMQTGLRVSVGDTIEQGSVVGIVGNTGFSTGPHLHFEVRINGTAVNPVGYLP